MEDWKAACRLALFELKVSKWVFPGLILIFGVMLLLFLGSASNPENISIVDDFFFTLLFTSVAAWMRPKDSQLTKINQSVQAGPPLIMFKQLPVTEDVLIKNRFIVYYAYFLPAQVIFLLMLYLLSPDLREILPPESYIAFSVIWVAFSFYAGALYPASDSGDIINKATIFLSVLFIAIGYFGTLALIHFLTGHGLLYWTIIAAQKWPLLSSVASILLAVIGLNYWYRYTKKTMRKLDYL